MKFVPNSSNYPRGNANIGLTTKMHTLKPSWIKEELYARNTYKEKQNVQKSGSKMQKLKSEMHFAKWKTKFWENKCKEMQYFAEKGKTHQLYKAINQAYGPKHSKNFTQTFLKKDGNPTTTPTESLERLQEYYCELLNRQPVIAVEKLDGYLQNFQKQIKWELDDVPTRFEMEKSLKA